jgi:hypothetical protein
MALKIGSKVEAGEGYPGRRDAFHVSAVLVKAQPHTTSLRPGDSVRFVDTFYHTVHLSQRNDRHGIVDPFLKEIKPDELFWVLLEPGLVGDLVHQFNLTTDLPQPQPVHDAGKYDDEDDYREGESQDQRRCRLEGC